MSNDSRTKNAARNLFFGTITRIYNLIIPFLMRTAMIYWLGMEYVGLNSRFGYDFQYVQAHCRTGHHPHLRPNAAL